LIPAESGKEVLQMAEAVAGFVPVFVRESFLAPVLEFVLGLEKGDSPVAAKAAANGTPIYERVQECYGRASDTMKRVFQRLADEPGEWVPSGEIARAIGPKAGSHNVAGVLGSYSNWVAPLDELVDSHWDYDLGSMVYSVDDGVAQVIKDLE
jgi:hypothetical protein